MGEQPAAREVTLPSRMLPSDALFWYAEEATPALRPVVGGLFFLDRAPHTEKLEHAFLRWVDRIPRLRQRVYEDALRLTLPEWRDDPHFELHYHLRHLELPPPGSRKELLELVSALFASPLDPARPLWEAYDIRGYQGTRAALLVKVHHCVMDGVGSMTGFDALTQAKRNQSIPLPRIRPSQPRPAPMRAARLATEALKVTTDNLRAAAALLLGAVRDPASAVAQISAATRGLWGVLSDLTSPASPDPLAQQATGIGRRLDGLTMPLPRLRKIKEALGVTLNDLMLTIVAGAVGRYYRHRKLSVDELHCMVPISLRREEERHLLGNRVGMCNVALPIGEEDPLRRLARIQEQTAAAKRDRRAAAYPFLMRVLTLTPTFVIRALAQATTGKINLIVTNVPGPSELRYLAGARIDAIYPYAPVTIGLPLAIALLSYADTYGIGIDTDPSAIPDPELLHHFLEQATDEVERAARVSQQKAPRPQRTALATRPARAQSTPTAGKPAKAIATSSSG
ncbi:MAG: wax ester/triacylglycerol synthase family O-acyltransferase [Candidatus Binatia bacterium]|nr:wax ester/triacylglycerol synthase family O-acyltransferase [Candidatus Binatia bacterium]